MTTVAAFVWGNYGRLVSNPIVAAVICISVIAMNLGLILGSEMWNVPLATDLSKLWINPDSEVAANNLHVETFGSTYDLGNSELLTLANADGSNMLTSASMDRFYKFMERIMDTVVFVDVKGHNNTAFTVLDICNGRNGQSPYTFGCTMYTPIEYFNEAKVFFPEQAAAQWLLDAKVAPTNIQLWAFAILGDLLSAGALPVYNTWFTKRCMSSMLILCGNTTELHETLNDKIASPTFPASAKLQFAWVKAQLALGAVMTNMSSSAASNFSGCPGDSQDMSDSFTQTEPLLFTNPYVLQALQGTGFVNNQTYSLQGVAVKLGGGCTTTVCASPAAALPLDFSNICASAIVAMMWWSGDLNIIDATLPARPLTTGNGFFDALHVDVSSVYENYVLGSAAGIAASPICTTPIPAGSLNYTMCRDLFYYSIQSLTLAGAQPTNQAAQQQLAGARALLLATSITAQAKAEIEATYPGGLEAAYTGWRNLLIGGAVPDVKPALLRFEDRPTYASKTPAEIGRIVSGSKNDLPTQNLRAAIFGSATPNARDIVSGKCVCTVDPLDPKATKAGAACNMPADTICDCDGELTSSCVSGILGSCMDLAPCLQYGNVTALLAMATILQLPADALADFDNFPNEMIVAGAFGLNFNGMANKFSGECQNYLMCVDGADIYDNDAYPFKKLAPASYKSILNDTTWSMAALSDIKAGGPTYQARANILFKRLAIGCNPTMFGAPALTGCVALLNDNYGSVLPDPMDELTLGKAITCGGPLADFPSCFIPTGANTTLGTFTNAALNQTDCPVTQAALNPAGSLLVGSYVMCLAEVSQVPSPSPFSPRSAASKKLFPPGPASFKTVACAGASAADGVSQTDLDAPQCQGVLGLALLQSINKTLESITDAAMRKGLLMSFFGSTDGAEPTPKQTAAVSQALVRFLAKSQDYVDFGTTQYPSSCSDYDTCPAAKGVIDQVLATSCQSGRHFFEPIALELDACNLVVDNLPKALAKDPVIIRQVSLGLAKYKLMGTLFGTCSATAGLIHGGGECWADTDCNAGTCNLTGNKPITETKVLATILQSNSPNGTVYIMKQPDGRYRKLANTPIFGRYQQRMDAQAGRRLAPINFGFQDAITNLDEEDANTVIRAWRQAAVASILEFREDFPTSKAEVVTADSAELLLADVSDADPKILILGYGLMLLYTLIACTNWSTDIQAMLNGSRALVGMVGVILVALSVASGLGISYLLDIQWSAAATQIVPFVMLGLGVSDTFIMLRVWPEYQDGLSAADAAAKALTIAGPPMLLVSATNVGVFAVGVVTGMPVVVNFALQSVIVVITNYFTTNLMFPALMVLDYKRTAAGRVDLAPYIKVGVSARAQVQVETSGYEMNSLNRFVTPYYSKCLLSIPGKIFVLAATAAFLIAGVYGVEVTAELGLQLSDVAPKNSDLSNALITRDSNFGFYTISVVTGPADWSLRETQQGLVKIYNDLMATEKVVDNSGTPWIQVMMSWGGVNTPLYNTNTSTNTMALCNPSNSRTGGKCGAYFGCTVVTADDSVLNGAIPFFPKATFYDCLEKWINNDLAYDALKPGFKLMDEFATKPNRKLYKTNDGKYLPISKGTLFTLGLNENPDFVQLIEEVNAVANSSTTPPSFIVGEPIDFWDQYTSLRQIINLAVGYGLLICFVVIFVLLICLVEGDASLPKRIFATFWASALTTAIIALSVYQLYGFMAFANLKISAIPAISIIMSTGVAVEFTAYIAVAFVNAPGTGNERAHHALMLMLTPVTDGAVTMFLGICMLAASPFVFIVKYFFYPWLLIIFFGMFNGVAFLPVLFALIGPPAVKSGSGNKTVDSKEVSPTA